MSTKDNWDDSSDDEEDLTPSPPKGDSPPDPPFALQSLLKRGVRGDSLPLLHMPYLKGGSGGILPLSLRLFCFVLSMWVYSKDIQCNYFDWL